MRICTPFVAAVFFRQLLMVLQMWPKTASRANSESHSVAIRSQRLGTRRRLSTRDSGGACYCAGLQMCGCVTRTSDSEEAAPPPDNGEIFVNFMF